MNNLQKLVSAPNGIILQIVKFNDYFVVWGEFSAWNKEEVPPVIVLDSNFDLLKSLTAKFDFIENVKIEQVVVFQENLFVLTKEKQKYIIDSHDPTSLFIFNDNFDVDKEKMEKFGKGARITDIRFMATPYDEMYIYADDVIVEVSEGHTVILNKDLSLNSDKTLVLMEGELDDFPSFVTSYYTCKGEARIIMGGALNQWGTKWLQGGLALLDKNFNLDEDETSILFNKFDSTLVYGVIPYNGTFLIYGDRLSCNGESINNIAMLDAVMKLIPNLKIKTQCVMQSAVICNVFVHDNRAFISGKNLKYSYFHEILTPS